MTAIATSWIPSRTNEPDGAATPAQAATAAGDTTALGSRLAEVITADLKGSGLFSPLDSKVRLYRRLEES